MQREDYKVLHLAGHLSIHFYSYVKSLINFSGIAHVHLLLHMQYTCSYTHQTAFS